MGLVPKMYLDPKTNARCHQHQPIKTAKWYENDRSSYKARQDGLCHADVKATKKLINLKSCFWAHY